MQPTFYQRLAVLFTGRIDPSIFPKLLLPLPLESRTPQPTIPALNPGQDAPFEAYFSPRGGCAAALCKEISKATVSLRVQAYQLTHPAIQAAILMVIEKGVPTEIILDKTQQQYGFGKRCQAAGATVFDDHSVKIAHNKVVLAEYNEPHPIYKDASGHPSRVARILVNGSFNFTENADSANAENMMIHRCHLIPQMVTAFDAFLVSFETRKKASLVWGQEHPTLGLQFEGESSEETNERLNG